MAQNSVTGLQDLLHRIEEGTDDRDALTLRAILEVIGPGSFGPVILLAGVITLLPVVGDIPGVPTAMAVLVLSASVQLFLGRKHLWLPRWLLDRSLTSAKARKAVAAARRPAAFLDRLVRPRLRALAEGGGVYASAAACTGIALAMPVMELIPFSANVAGAALTAFGLALIARDGIVAAIAFAFTAGVVGLAVNHFL